MTKEALLQALRGGESLSRRQQLHLVALLSTPAMLAQLSSIVMQYIDAAMVAHLGANAMGAIGLVCSTLWLATGLCGAAATGFYVMASHKVGARQYDAARRVMHVSIPATFCWSGMLALVCWLISSRLPHWLGGGADICADATAYFLIYVSFLPVWQINALASGMLRSAGNVKAPSILNALMCFFDVLFNYLFIFKMHMGVAGAAWGTASAEVVVMIGLLVCMFRQREYKSFTSLSSLSPSKLPLELCHPSPVAFGDGQNAEGEDTLSIEEYRSNVISPSLTGEGWRGAAGSRDGERLGEMLGMLLGFLRIATPMALERICLVGAQIASTVIVAPLGTIAIAANALGITIEAICYMPGFGIGDASSTLVGQSHGAGRPSLVYSFSRITLWLGVGVMTLMGTIMFIGAPALVGIMGPEADVGSLCVSVLRIEAFAEPMYGASIVGYCIFVALGDALVPCLMNLATIWGIRITLAAVLAPVLGLPGVWLAMAIELTVRGLIFLIRLHLKIRKP